MTDRTARPWTRMRQTTAGELLAEFLGTAILIILGCGSVAVAVVGLPGSGRQTVDFGPANWLIIAWGWGLAVVFAVYVAGGVSGAHINPAVTLAWAIRRKFPWAKVLPYWAAQVVGAFAGAAVVLAVYHNAIDAFLASQNPPTGRDGSVGTFSIFATFPAEYFGNGVWGPLVDQIVGTAILVAIIAAIIDARNQPPSANLAPFVVGLVVVAIGLTYGTNAGYAINPARDLGPRLLAFFAGWGDAAFPGNGEWFSSYWWIPIVGPLVGGVVGVLVYDFFIGSVLAVRPAPGAEPTPPPGRVPGSADGDAGDGARSEGDVLPETDQTRSGRQVQRSE
ncbi:MULTISPECIES: MIP/aquaporin family protein [Amycolatopsis]|uniref:MIP/aquaporin family protein n=1 Tax=Amycolatopsis tucumanensis TaxID=401106 RepID=A0ABP7JLE2_9PSEU|nr:MULTISPECIES: MIP/aquaporin family protein [Amycolatopsis]MCF6426731.1 aquaporin family protein [Amycolatopsis tucumanensis]